MSSCSWYPISSPFPASTTVSIFDSDSVCKRAIYQACHVGIRGIYFSRGGEKGFRLPGDGILFKHLLTVGV